MKRVLHFTPLLLSVLVAAACGDSHTAPRTPDTPPSYSSAVHGGGRTGFGFNATVLGANGQTISLNGGGSFDASTASNTIPTETSGHGNGGFRCITDITSSPLAGCAAGEGVRWDTEQLLVSSPFKCGGVANEGLKTATTGDGVVVLQADFYRAGDGNDESFKAKIFIADHDLAPDVDGVQNIWIQGFGCGTGIVNFSR
jgi:hypothetical protein